MIRTTLTMFAAMACTLCMAQRVADNGDISRYSDDNIRERVVVSHGKRTLQIDADQNFSFPGEMADKSKKHCFIVISKKDYYLYVYEAQGKDTVILARYDCCFGLKKGNKQKRGDMKTPSCTMSNPFTISQIADASSWKHDFGDGRGNIKAYGRYFLRLVTPGHSGIGIHGSTNNEGSVPGRASEGCIRLGDKWITDLGANYAYLGMKVIIKDESVDDYPFEVKAMQRLKEKKGMVRKRHLNPSNTLSNERVQSATTEPDMKNKSLEYQP